MATKENINFNSSFSDISYEEIDAIAWPANPEPNHQTNQATEAKIRDFRRRKLGRSALRSLDALDFDRLAA